MKKIFGLAVEDGRDRTDMHFATKSGDRFGLFRFKSPFSGATLRVIVGNAEIFEEGFPGQEGWDHVSVSCIDKPPRWEDMCYIKDLFFDEDECVMQLHPPKKDYVNTHENCLHLWKPARTPIPVPPKECV